MVTTLSGLYSLRIRAEGLTTRGGCFSREQTHTAAVYPGGDSQEIVDAVNRQHDQCGCLARVLDCLFCGKTGRLKFCRAWRFLFALMVILVLITLLLLAFRLVTLAFT